jgi:hypothetical protein
MPHRNGYTPATQLLREAHHSTKIPIGMCLRFLHRRSPPPWRAISCAAAARPALLRCRPRTRYPVAVGPPRPAPLCAHPFPAPLLFMPSLFCCRRCMRLPVLLRCRRGLPPSTALLLSRAPSPSCSAGHDIVAPVSTSFSSVWGVQGGTELRRRQNK